MIAVHLGPSGLGMLGQLSNFIAVILPVCCLGFNSGIVKFVAELRYENNYALQNLLSNAFKLTVLASVLIGILVVFFSTRLSRLLLGNSNYFYIFVVGGTTFLLYAVNNFYLSVLNGLKEFKTYNAISMAATMIGFVLTVVLSLIYSVEGALCALLLAPSLTFFLTHYQVNRLPLLKSTSIRKIFKVDWASIKPLYNFTFMALVSAGCLPVAQIFIRYLLSQEVSFAAAGIWEGINRISNNYLLVVTTALSTYYLPRLSELSSESELKSEIRMVYKITIPVLFLISGIIYLARDLIVNLLFSTDFMPMTDLFFFQLLGDLLKVASWILAFQMVARVQTRLYVVSELIFSLSLVGLSAIFINWYGLNGAVIAFCANYFLYFLLMVYVFRRSLF